MLSELPEALTGSAEHDVEVHAVDADVRVVLDAEVDMLLDAESEVASIAEVGPLELELLHLKYTSVSSASNS